MSQDIPIPETKYTSSDTWDKMDKTDPYSMIMKVAALQAATKVVMETPDLVAPKQPKLKRNDNSPGPLARARIDEELGELKEKLEKTEAEVREAKSQREYWYNAYVMRLKKEQEEGDKENLVPSEVVNQPFDEEDSDSVLSAREKAEQDRLFERIVVSSYASEEENHHDPLLKSIKDCTEADNNWGLYEYKAVFKAPTHFAEFYKKSMDDVVTTQCNLDGGEVESITFSDVKNR